MRLDWGREPPVLSFVRPLPVVLSHWRRLEKQVRASVIATNECGGKLSFESSTLEERMRKSIAIAAFLILSTFPAVGVSTLQSQSGTAPAISIDLRSGLLNGRPVLDWTLEQVTDSFGRPNAISDGIGDIVGPQLHYHTRGLTFWFTSKAKDPTQHVWILTVYLARDFDEPHSAWYEPFSGDLVPAVDANWKTPRLVTEFAAFKPEIKTVEDSRREFKTAGNLSAFKPPSTDFVSYYLSNLRVTFAVEPNTKFVERIVFAADDSKHKRP